MLSGALDIQAFFIAGIIAEAIDFLYFDSSPIASALLGLGWFIVNSKISKISIIKMWPSVVILAILIENRSLVSYPLKAGAFLIQLSWIAILPEISGSKIDFISERKRKFNEIVLSCLFAVLAFNCFFYFNYGIDYIINPNTVGTWSALYLVYSICLSIAIKKHSPVFWVSFAFAFLSLLNSGCRTAQFILLPPIITAVALRQMVARYVSSKILTVIAFVLVGGLGLVFVNYRLIQQVAEILVPIKQKTVGGSVEESDFSRLLDIPQMALSEIDSSGKGLFGIGVYHADSSYSNYNQDLPHNLFYLLVSYVGLVGLGCYLLMIFRAIQTFRVVGGVYVLTVYLLCGLAGSAVLRGGGLPIAFMLTCLMVRRSCDDGSLPIPFDRKTLKI
jgi:hypothetical protein